SGTVAPATEDRLGDPASVVERTAAKDEALSYPATTDEDQGCPRYADGIGHDTPGSVKANSCVEILFAEARRAGSTVTPQRLPRHGVHRRQLAGSLPLAGARPSCAFRTEVAVRRTAT